MPPALFVALGASIELAGILSSVAISIALSIAVTALQGIIGRSTVRRGRAGVWRDSICGPHSATSVHD